MQHTIMQPGTASCSSSKHTRKQRQQRQAGAGAALARRGQQGLAWQLQQQPAKGANGRFAGGGNQRTMSVVLPAPGVKGRADGQQCQDSCTSG